MRAKQEKILKIVITAIMVILGLICIYPFIFMLSSSFKPSGDVLSTPLQIIPSNFTMMNFETLFNNEFYDFFQWFGNTVVMTGLTLILKFFIITITAYGFAKMKFPGRYQAVRLRPRAGLRRPDGRRDPGFDPRHCGLLPVPEVLRGRHHRRRSQGLILQQTKGVFNAMRDRALLPAAGQFYKANLHCHTVLSDGRWTKEQVKAEYQKRGYSIVAFTDHRHYGWHPELMDDTFIPIAAYEADLNGPFPPSGSFQWVKTYHLNFYDTDPAARGGFTAVQPPQQYGDLEALNGFIARMNADGFLCCYNHPYWSLQNYNDYAGLKGAFAMEIYNHGCELDGLYGYAPQAYDEMLRAGQKLFCVATDDNHDTYAPGDPRCDSFGGFTMFKLEKLTYASVIEALKKGDFYASTGPELQELYIRDGALCVRCSPVEKIYVVTSGRRCLMKLAAPGETLTEAVFPLNGDEGYVRVDCRDGQGRHAYSNAYWLDE